MYERRHERGMCDRAVEMTDVGATAAPTGPIARGSVARVGAATALAVACVYTVIYLAARDLPPACFSIFAVFWGALGIATGATHGLLQETTREVRWVRSTQIVAGHRTHPLRVAGMIGTVAAVVIAGSSPLWSRQLFVEGRWLSVGLLSVGVAGFCAQAIFAFPRTGSGDEGRPCGADHRRPRLVPGASRRPWCRTRTAHTES